MEVRGRGGRVTNASLYRWVGSEWARETLVSVDTAVGDLEIELRTAVPSATFNMTRLVAVTADWSGIADISNAARTRSGTRGDPLFVPMHGTSPDTAIAQALGSEPTVDGDCTDSAYNDAGTFSNPGVVDGWVGTYNTFVYICLDVLGDNDDDGTSDFARIYFDRDHAGNITAGDRRFAVTSSSGLVTPESRRGNDAGNAWVDCTLSSDPGAIECRDGNRAQGKFSTYQVYEFKVHYTDVWNKTSPDAGQIAGFAVIETDISGGPWTWGNSSPQDLDATTWGHLEIPEFGAAVPVAVVTTLAIGVLGRRRRLRVR